MTSQAQHDIPRGCPIGKVLGAPYAGVMRRRRWAYHRGVLRSASAGAAVISVSASGSGIEPGRVVEYMALVEWSFRSIAHYMCY